MKSFRLIRTTVRNKGKPGTVAEGVEFSDGRCAVAWSTWLSSMSCHRDIDDVLTMFGHDGEMVVVWDQETAPVPEVPVSPELTALILWRRHVTHGMSGENLCHNVRIALQVIPEGFVASEHRVALAAFRSFAPDAQDRVVRQVLEQAEDTLRIRLTTGLSALIKWRDSLVQDTYGEELIQHVWSVLETLSTDEVPPEHLDALRVFKTLDEDVQREMVRTVLESEA